MENNVKKYNSEQKKAIEHGDGPLLIVAGAGTGKTTVLIGRLQHLIEKKLASAEEILLMTFTEKATAEMEDRALKELPYGYVDLWINTFHGFCERILREHALDIGLSNSFKIMSTTDQWILIKKNLEKFDLGYYAPLGNPNKFIYELVKHFSRLKDEDIKASDYLEYAESLDEDLDNKLGGDKRIKNQESRIMNNGIDQQEISRIGELANAYHTYNKLLLDEGYLDFGDLITYTIKLFKERPNILKFYQEKFKYVMIDEFQDTNWAQYELIKMLINKKKNLLVVGDDDQSIFKFRGASLSNIMQFKDEFPDTKEVVLNKNYRSGQNILDYAYTFIKHNDPNRLEVSLGINKKINSQTKQIGKTERYQLETEQAETEFVAEKIKEIYKTDKDAEWSDFAILIRANSQADKFTAELTRKRIPNLFLSLRGLYYKPIILDILAYFKLLDNYHESSALFRVLNMEIFKVPHSDIIAINKFARKKTWSLFEGLKNINAISDVSPEAVANINKLLALVAKHSLLAKDRLPSEIFVNFIWDAGLNTKDYDREAEYYSYINQFYQKVKNFEINNPDARLKDFMELMDLEMEAGETGGLKLDFADDEAVRIMTVHASKGLEFKYVFLVNLVDKRFPTINRRDKIAIPDELVKEKLSTEGNAHIEEERRLFYVALTRAKRELFLTSAKDCGGAREKKPSAFLDEAGVNPKVVEMTRGKELELIKDLEDLHSPKENEIQKYSLPTRFSFSQIEAYSSCPLQYKFNFILRIPVLAKDQFIFGRVMHNILKDFFESSARKNSPQVDLFGTSTSSAQAKPSLKDLMRSLEDNWINDGYKTKEDREKYKKKAKKILNGFYEVLERDGWPEVMFLEKVFSFPIVGYHFRGAIDRIDKLPDGTIEIVDYKTGNPKDKLDSKAKRQLILYKIVVEEGFGLKVSKLSFYYLENNVKISFEARDKEIEKLKLDVKKVIEEIKKGNFVPKPSMLCKYCDFRSICEFKK